MSLGNGDRLVVDPAWRDFERARLRHSFWSEGPCDSCELRKRCAAEQIACASYAVWMRNPLGDWREQPRKPNARAFAAAHDDAPTKLGRL